MKELQEEFEDLTCFESEAPTSEHYPHLCGTGTYSDEYVKWLESELNELRIAYVSGSGLLNDLLKEQRSIINSPIRFDGVSVETIKRIFEQNGVKYENPF